MAQLIKTVNGLAIASVKTMSGLAIASVKTIGGVDNTAAGGTPAFSEFVHSALSDQATKTATLTVASGNLLVAQVIWADASTTCTVDDDKSNEWVQIGTTTSTDTDMFTQLWYAKSANAGSTIVSAHLGVTHFSILGVWEASGCSITAPLDGTGGEANGHTATPTTGSTATANAVEFLVAGFGNFGGDSGVQQTLWTEDYDSGDFAEFQHFVTSSSSTYSGTVTWLGISSTVGKFAAFKA